MAVKKQVNSVATIKFDEKAKEAMEALLFLKTFNRKQGRFLTALITWFLEHKNELCYNESSGKIVDISAVYDRMKRSNLDDSTVRFLNDNPETFSAVACVVMLLEGAVIDRSSLTFIMKVLSSGATAKVLSVLSKAVNIDVTILSALMKAMQCGVTEEVFLELTDSGSGNVGVEAGWNSSDLQIENEVSEKIAEVEKLRDNKKESLKEFNGYENEYGGAGEGITETEDDEDDDFELDSSQLCHLG